MNDYWEGILICSLHTTALFFFKQSIPKHTAPQSMLLGVSASSTLPRVYDVSCLQEFSNIELGWNGRLILELNVFREFSFKELYCSF